jgi:hypothetical protein
MMVQNKLCFFPKYELLKLKKYFPESHIVHWRNSNAIVLVSMC